LIDQSLAHPAHQSTLKLSARLQRGIALGEERFEEIHRIAPWIWEVPSCSGEHTYTVYLKTSCCSCPDRVQEGERCKHETAARYVKARTAKCSGCCKRFRHRELYSVSEDHLTFFEGELLCEECACAHGLL
jgi:cytidylate kinase